MTGTDDALDLLVVGSGVAGLTAAVRAADQHGLRVGVITKGKLDQGTTPWAQGGVAAVLGDETDSTDLHLTDTLNAGAGLCDPDAVRVLVDDGPRRVNELVALGAMFDTDELGRLALAREGGHSLARIVHAGGAATGQEVERALVAAVQLTATAVFDHTFAFELIVEGGECAGVRSLDRHGDEVSLLGRTARDARTVKSAADKFDYVFVGPDVSAASPALRAALENMPHFDVESTPWFLRCAATAAEDFIVAGARRLALGVDLLEKELGKRGYVASDAYSLGDINVFNSTYSLPLGQPELCNRERTPNIMRWLRTVYHRPAVQETWKMGSGRIVDRFHTMMAEWEE